MYKNIQEYPGDALVFAAAGGEAWLLESLTYTIERDKAPIYTMGQPSLAATFTRDRILGSFVSQRGFPSQAIDLHVITDSTWTILPSIFPTTLECNADHNEITVEFVSNGPTEEYRRIDYYEPTTELARED